MGQCQTLFLLFSSFSHYNFNNTNWKSTDGVLGIRTSSCRMVGTGNTMELWWPPDFEILRMRFLPDKAQNIATNVGLRLFKLF